MEEIYLSQEDNILFDEDFEIIENKKIFPYMLFHSLTEIFPMLKYEEELANINDFIYYNNDNLNKILKEKNKEIEQAKIEKPFGEYHNEGIMVMENDELIWKWLINKVNICNNIVLFLSFLEGALKEIFEWYIKENKEYISKKRERNTNKIEYYLKEISACCNYELSSKLRSQLKIIDDAKIIRNIFVHEWDAYYNQKNNKILEEKLEKFKLTSLIDSISKVLYMCEYAGIKGKILESDENGIFGFLAEERKERMLYQATNINLGEDLGLIKEIVQAEQT